MVTIKIGRSELAFDNVSSVDENWITRQIDGLRHDGEPICIRVTLNTSSVNIILMGGACEGPSGGVPRQLTREEEAAFDLWEKLGLNDGRIESGKVVAFFKQVRRIAG